MRHLNTARSIPTWCKTCGRGQNNVRPNGLPLAKTPNGAAHYPCIFLTMPRPSRTKLGLMPGVGVDGILNMHASTIFDMLTTIKLTAESKDQTITQCKSGKAGLLLKMKKTKILANEMAEEFKLGDDELVEVTVDGVILFGSKIYNSVN